MARLPIGEGTKAGDEMVTCPACGFQHFARSTSKCPLCGEPTPSSAPSAPRAPYRVGIPKENRQIDRTFSLSALMLLVTLISVCLGVIMAAPGLGVPLAILSVPAFARTSAEARRDRALGNPTGLGEKLQFFFSSLALTVLIGIAGCVAFCAACFASCAVFVLPTESESAFILACIIGVAAAIVAIVWLFRRTWPRRNN